MSLLSLLPDSLRRTADMAVIFVMEHPEVFGEFLEASLAQEYPMAMRASRVVHLCALEEPELIAIIQYNLPESTAAFKAQSRQIVKKLEKEIITGR